MGLFDNPLENGRSFSDLKKYINDFKIVEEKDAKGRLRKKAVYTGVWFVPAEKPEKTRWKLIGTVAMALLLMAAYVRMILLTHASSGQYPVMVPMLLGLFPGMYLMMGILSLPFRGNPMRRDQYMHSFIRASRSAVALGICDLVALTATMVYRAVKPDWIYFPEDWLYTSLAVAVPALAAGIIFLLRSIDLDEKPNDTVVVKTKQIF